MVARRALGPSGRRRIVLGGFVVLTLVACSGDDATTITTARTIAPPVAETATDTVVDSAVDTTSTSPRTTTVVETAPGPDTTPPTTMTTAMTTDDTVPVLSAPAQVGTIPTIPIPPGDPNVRPPLPEDVPILEAYAAYIEAFYAAAAGDPGGDAALAATTTDDFYGRITAMIARRRADNLVLNDALGITLRTAVVEEPRSNTEVFVLDCQLDGTYWADGVTGLPVEGEAPAPRINPISARLVLRDGRWLVDAAATDGRACVA